MQAFLPRSFVGIIAGILFLTNILISASLVILLGILQLLFPIPSLKKFFNYLQEQLISLWIDINNIILQLAGTIEWEVHGTGPLNIDHWYFVFANHQTWVDILILQKVFNRKIRLLKFFLKSELLWTLPVGGIACWIMGFPVMKRYSKTAIKKNPSLRNKDIETTQKACKNFMERPTTIMNFLEGTRFTEQKQKERSSPYKSLLRPKAGGLAFVVNELKDYIHEIIDVTIVYPSTPPSFWDLVCGKISKVTVYYEVLSLEPSLYGDYYKDPAFRKHFQHFINDRWRKKNDLIESIRPEATSTGIEVT